MEKKKKKSTSKKTARAKKTANLFSVGQVAKMVGVAGHTIRFWQQNFSSIKYVLGKGDRKYYNQDAVDYFVRIKDLMYNKGIKIAGIQKMIAESGPGILSSALFSAHAVLPVSDEGSSVESDCDLLSWAEKSVIDAPEQYDADYVVGILRLVDEARALVAKIS